MKRLFALLTLAAMPAFGDAIAPAPTGVVVAHSGAIELIDDRGRSLWKTDGVALPMKVVVSRDRAAVIDSLSNETRIVDLRTGRGSTVRSGETPIDGLFLGNDLFLLERDSSSLSKVAGDGRTASILVAADPAFLRAANGRLYVYSRREGVFQEIEPAALKISRTLSLPPFASDMELDARNAYLLYPRAAKVRAVELRAFKESGEIPIGAVPVDLALAGGANAISARTLAVADPSAKRVWITEGSQSLAQAVARGFLRGLLGLGLYSNRASEFATGVDRVMAAGGRWVAYDSSSRTLYRVTRSRSAEVARDVDPAAFAIRGDTLFFWQKGRLFTAR